LPSVAVDSNATYSDAVCVNAAIEINMLDYAVAVRKRAVCICVHLQMQICRIFRIHRLIWIIFLRFSCGEIYS